MSDAIFTFFMLVLLVFILLPNEYNIDINGTQYHIKWEAVEN